jgi:hypothetical protein
MEAIKPTDIVVDSEFEELIRPLSQDERKELKESLSICGLLMPLVIWKHEGKTILVDGHNRLSLWKEFDGFGDFEFKTQELRFGNRDKVKEWIIKNQLGRRNLSPDDFRGLLGMLYNARKKEAHRPEKRGQSELVNPQRTAEAIASEYGVSPSTVKRAGKREEERKNGAKKLSKREQELKFWKDRQKLSSNMGKIKYLNPDLTDEEVKEKAEAAMANPSLLIPQPDQETAFDRYLEKRWNIFIKEIPVTNHSALREWIGKKLKRPAL